MLRPRIMFRVFTLLLLAGIASSSTYAQMAKGVTASPRITAVVDDTNLTTLKGNVHPLATAANDQGAAPDSLALGRTMLVLKSSAAQGAALKKLTDDQQNVKSPSYHSWLTPAEYGSRFGVAPEDLAKINNWLESHGFAVEPQMAGRNIIMFSGTNAQLNAAFHVQLHNYNVKGKSYTAISSNPQIPAAFSDVIASISPNNFPLHSTHTAPKLMQHTSAGWKATAAAQPQFNTSLNGSSFQAIAPYDLARIYNILPLWEAGIDGTGETIAIVSDSNINPADIDAWRSIFGLPATKLNTILYGPDPGITGDGLEASLDVEWAGSVAKNATIDLIVANNSNASGGIIGAAVYDINNNLASLLNVSYDGCEQGFGTAESQFVTQLWEQAASQGITVLVASGDSGSDTCDGGGLVAQNGLSVNALASTAYDVAVGGTDFSGNYPDETKYWGSTNDPLTQASALSYIPESPWNNSCANPLILAALQGQGRTGDTTTLGLCNDSAQAAFLSTTGGGGGASNCAVTGSDLSNPCISGVPKPAWQSGVNGIPADGVRDLPDMSLMAGNGDWGSLYVLCDSSYTGQACTTTTGLVGAGGTSFASPIFAGMLALVQQKQQAAGLGNVNYVLYKLGAAEYADPTSTTCSSSTVVDGNACIFYDITTGNNALPCLIYTVDCNPIGAINQFGILPGYSSTAGYDLASGLGTINANNLVEKWNSASSQFLPTTTTLTGASTNTAVYGQSFNLKVTVAPIAPAIGIPSGDVGFTSSDPTPNNASLTDLTLSNGAGTVAVKPLSAGTYQVSGSYAGDATFAPSTSSGLSVTISKAAPALLLTSTASSAQSGQNVTFSLEASGVINGVAPTGSVVFTNTATGANLTVEGLPESSTFNGVAIATWFVTIPQSQLQSGANIITASYSGDSNYLGASAGSVTVAATHPTFTTTVSQPSVTLTSGHGSLAVSVTPSGQSTLLPNSIVLSCPAAVGVTCTFGPMVIASDGALSSTLSVQLAPAPLQADVPKVNNLGANLSTATLAGGFAGTLLLLLPRRRRSYGLTALCFFILPGLLLTIGCGSIHIAPSTVTSTNPTTTILSVSSTTPLAGSPTVFTALVTPVSGNGVPTGSVTFASGTARLGTSPLVAGSARFSSTALPSGSQAVIASYSGDSAYQTSTSAVALLNVSSAVALTVTASDAFGHESSANVSVIVQ